MGRRRTTGCLSKRCSTATGQAFPGATCRRVSGGGTAQDNRLFVEAVLYRYRAGIPWRDLPPRFREWKIVWQRFDRWAKSGVFERIFKTLASDHDNEYMSLDATIVRAHQHSAGAQKKRAKTKPSDAPEAD
ncbi:transposase [Mesorhizobium sp. L103C131B0]|nr:transposase [Mesorhizobium sp. L103C131B0]